MYTLYIVICLNTLAILLAVLNPSFQNIGGDGIAAFVICIVCLTFTIFIHPRVRKFLSIIKDVFR